MKRTVLVFGLIAGVIVTAMWIYSLVNIMNNENFKASAVLGYASMVVAFAFVFVGIKNFRDKYNGGAVSFGKAFRIGLYITLIASTMYVLAWLVEYYFFVPDFMEKYTACTLRDAKANGASAAELTEKAAEMAKFGEMYKNPVWVVLFTYVEILPVGLLIALISALILKRKTPAVATA